MYTLLCLLDKRTFAMASIHAFACALLIDIRVIGITLPLYTFIFLFADIVKISTHREKVKSIKIGLVYISLLALFIVIFWPLLWSHSFLNLIMAVRKTKNYYNLVTFLYLGKYIRPENQPWHYVPIWIIISTPIFYTFCFLAGWLALIKTSINNSIKPV